MSSQEPVISAMRKVDMRGACMTPVMTAAMPIRAKVEALSPSKPATETSM